jgi:hypothetical protein
VDPEHLCGLGLVMPSRTAWTARLRSAACAAPAMIERPHWACRKLMTSPHYLLTAMINTDSLLVDRGRDDLTVRGCKWRQGNAQPPCRSEATEGSWPKTDRDYLVSTIGVGKTWTCCRPVSPSTYPDALQVAPPCRKRLPPVPVNVTSNGCEVPSQTAGSR